MKGDESYPNFLVDSFDLILFHSLVDNMSTTTPDA